LLKSLNYSPDKHKKAIKVIESSDTKTELEEIYKSLFLSCRAGLDDERINEKKQYANFAYKNREIFDPSNRLIAANNYLFYISRDETSLNIWCKLLEDYSNYAKSPYLNYRIIDPIINQCFVHNDYDFLLKVMRHINGSSDCSVIDAHAFICPVIENSKFIMTKYECFESERESIINDYITITKAFNAIGNYATSLRGDFEVDFSYDDPNRFGTIDQDAPCHILREATEKLYNLQKSTFQNVETVTIIPFHNHPIQSSLCHIGVEPPLLLLSMNPAMPTPLDSEYVFFLSTETITYEIERNFIHSIFGSDAFIITNPGLATVKEYIELESTTHIYISAHGIYKHWKLGDSSIHFKEGIEVLERDLASLKNRSLRRTQKIRPVAKL
jgi:hypothetical protein